jgi:hypothetical protein
MEVTCSRNKSALSFPTVHTAGGSNSSRGQLLGVMHNIATETEKSQQEP